MILNTTYRYGPTFINMIHSYTRDVFSTGSPMLYLVYAFEKYVTFKIITIDFILWCIPL